MTITKEDQCILCSKSAQISCNFCGEKFCGKSHESVHRSDNSDENSCFAFKIQETEGVGRYMVAARDISAGEVIYTEAPIEVGPNQETTPICLSCNKKVDCSYICSDCLYPLCNKNCAESSFHLDLCKIFKNETKKEEVLQFDGSQTSPHSYAYHAILPIKLWLLKANDPDRFALMDRLMDHNEERRKDIYWSECQQKVVDRIISRCGRSDLEESEIHRMIGILETNAYEIYSNCHFGFRGLFPLSSLISHGCKSNIFQQFSSKFPYTNTCIAAVDIKKGEELFSIYVNATQCTLTRRKKLSECWYFDCTCSRCSDPTELGSFAGAIICKACPRSKNGEPSYMLQRDPLNFNSEFECSNCNSKQSSKEVEALINEYLGKTQELSYNFVEQKEELISLHSLAASIFHPQHEVMTELATWLVPALCRPRANNPQEFSLSELALKKNLCQNAIKLLDCVNPGINRKRGKFLYELAESEVNYISHGPEDEQLPSLGELIAKIEQIITYCKESRRCLSNIGQLKPFDDMMLRSGIRLQDNAETLLKRL